MSNRNLFEELKQGMQDWSDLNADKITLKTHTVSQKKNISMSPEELKAVRRKLRLSQAVFANYLHTDITT